VAANGTLILLLSAVGLWVAYLLPLWIRRSEYYAAQKNAARLEQTIRFLAQSAETWEELKAELRTRDIAQKDREAQARLTRVSSPRGLQGVRRRRVRQICSVSLFLVVGLAVFSVFASWPLPVFLALLVAGAFCLAMLSGINTLAQQHSSRKLRNNFARPTARQKQHDSQAWTPRSLPMPLEKKTPDESLFLPNHDELVRTARVKALAERPEDFSGEGLAQVLPLANSKNVSGATEVSGLNLDEVMRRRRAV